MAKGQLRSNKEAKKPKKEKAQPAAGRSPLTARLVASQEKTKDKGK
jgi:hypothetical protein